MLYVVDVFVVHVRVSGMPMNMSLTRQPRVATVAKIPLSLLATVIVFYGATRFAVSADGPDIAPRKDYAPLAATLRPFIEREMAEKQIPGLSIALVDDQKTVWAQGFGLADSQSNKPATAATVYRIGSVSKLFTDIAIMQLVERGELNLDAPVSEYLPNFRPEIRLGRRLHCVN